MATASLMALLTGSAGCFPEGSGEGSEDSTDGTSPLETGQSSVPRRTRYAISAYPQCSGLKVFQLGTSDPTEATVLPISSDGLDVDLAAQGEELSGAIVSPSGEYVFVALKGRDRKDYLRSYAFQKEDGSLRVVSQLPLGEQDAQTDIRFGWNGALSITPDGRQIAIGARTVPATASSSGVYWVDVSPLGALKTHGSTGFMSLGTAQVHFVSKLQFADDRTLLVFATDTDGWYPRAMTVLGEGVGVERTWKPRPQTLSQSFHLPVVLAPLSSDAMDWLSVSQFYALPILASVSGAWMGNGGALFLDAPQFRVESLGTQTWKYEAYDFVQTGIVTRSGNGGEGWVIRSQYESRFECQDAAGSQCDWGTLKNYVTSARWTEWSVGFDRMPREGRSIEILGANHFGHAGSLQTDEAHWVVVPYSLESHNTAKQSLGTQLGGTLFYRLDASGAPQEVGVGESGEHRDHSCARSAEGSVSWVIP